MKRFNRNLLIGSLIAAAVVVPAYAEIDFEPLPWQETFTLANGVKSDVAPTSWVATRSSGKFMVNNNRMMINGAGTQGVLTTGPVYVNGLSAKVTLDLVSQGSLETNQDYVKIYKKMDGGAEVLIAEKKGNQAANTISVSGITGEYLQLVIRAYVSAADEYYYIDNISITATPLNQPPSVTITSPANSASFTAPASVTVTAGASDPDGSVSKVELRSNGTLVGTDNASPYSFSLTGLAAGSYALEARAYDNANATTNTSISISVNSAPENIPWLESFTMINGAKSDLPPTSWTAIRSSGNFAVNGNRLMVNGAGTEAVLTTGVIDISSGMVAVSMDLVSAGLLENNQDYVKMFKKVNGGAEVLIAAKWGVQAATSIQDLAISGTTLQIVIRARVSAGDEYYYIDNLNVTLKNTAAWQPLGNPVSKSATSYADMIAVNGVTYVAVADPDFGNRLTVYRHYGTSWEPLGTRGFSDNAVSDVKMGQENGELYVFYIEENPTGRFGYVRKCSGTGWQTIGSSWVTSIGRTAEDIEINNGTVYVSFTENVMDGDCYYGVPTVLSRTTYGGAGWEEIGRDCTWKYNSPFHLSLENGVLYREFHYDDPQTAGIYIDRFDGTTWEPVTRRSNDIFSTRPAMAFDGSKAYFAYVTRENSGLNCEMFDGTNWIFVGAADFITGDISDLSVTVSNGKPYIAFKKDGLLSVVAFTAGVWELVGAAGFTSGPWSGDYGYGVDGKLCINGTTPTLLLSMLTSPTCTVMHFPTTTPAWKNAGAPLFKSAPAFADMITVNGVMYVAASDPAYGNRLTVYKRNGALWEPVGNRGFSNKPVGSTLLAQYNGEVYAAYIDSVSNSGTGYVKKFNGTSWQTFGTTPFTTIGTRVDDIEINNGVVYVAFTNYIEPQSYECYYGSPRMIAKCSGNAWVEIRNECSGKFGSTNQLSSANGLLYAETHEQYYPYSTSISLYSYNGSEWQSVTAKQLPDNAREGMKVILDGAKIYAVYTDDNTNSVRCEMFDGVVWSVVGAEISLQGPIPGFAITVSSSGRPYIALEKNGLISVISYVNSNWELVGNPNFASSLWSEWYGYGNNGKILINGTTPTVLLSTMNSQVFSVMKFE